MVGINDLLRKSRAPILDSILILCKLLDVDKSYIYTYGEREISKEIESKFLQLVEKRTEGYPIQYILGERVYGIGLLFGRRSSNP